MIRVAHRRELPGDVHLEVMATFIADLMPDAGMESLGAVTRGFQRLNEELAISFDRLAFYVSPVQSFSETKREEISKAFSKY